MQARSRSKVTVGSSRAGLGPQRIPPMPPNRKARQPQAHCRHLPETEPPAVAWRELRDQSSCGGRSASLVAVAVELAGRPKGRPT